MDEIVTLVKFEYHVLYHISYAVPYLCFTGIKSGISITLLILFHFFQVDLFHTHRRIKYDTR